MDRITQSLLDKFSAENKLKNLPESSQFEHFCAFLTVKRHYSRSIDSSNLVVGSGSDTGIDALAIIVNGMLVTDIDMIDEIKEQNGYLEVSFIFIQSERSSSFDGSKIGTIGFGVQDFLKTNRNCRGMRELQKQRLSVQGFLTKATCFASQPHVGCTMSQRVDGKTIKRLSQEKKMLFPICDQHRCSG